MRIKAILNNFQEAYSNFDVIVTYVPCYLTVLSSSGISAGLEYDIMTNSAIVMATSPFTKSNPGECTDAI